ncbi:hypothetical protein BDR06DRAFT_198540 [Suillus hirtellus]|nr:hypothetical protein BDR06DRAFT_198540 [Suillus hirtellus]
MLLFALRRFKDKSSGRSSLFSFAEISEITAFHLDGSCLYQCSHCSISSVVSSLCFIVRTIEQLQLRICAV